VLLLWVEQFEDCFAEDLDMRSLARRQLYVAMPRAQDELHLIAGGNAGVVNALGKSEAINVAQCIHQLPFFLKTKKHGLDALNR
jgi:superfamily I DNA/RNA helicase